MKFRKWICLCVAAALALLGAAGCGAKKDEAALTKTCFIDTDGLIDDLCAIEYLSTKYDHAVICLHNSIGFLDNPYASEEVTDEASFFDLVSRWFKKAEAYSDPADIAEADLYLLAPLTEFAAILKENPSLKSNRALLMAGDSDGPDGAGEEWNAIVDPEAYRYVTESMTNMTQMTRPECEADFEKNGYPFQAQLLEEYQEHMVFIVGHDCCYDLQAAALFLS